MSSTPPYYRNDVSLPLSKAAENNQFKLPVCGSCQTVQYPPREICHNCLSSDLTWQDSDPNGTLLSQVALHHSLEPYFMDHLPWPTGTVQLKNGAVMITHLLNEDMSTGQDIEIQAVIDPSGRATLIAKPKDYAHVSWADIEKERQK